jgi:WD40 repeat protein
MATMMETTREIQVLPYPSISGYEVLEEIGRGGMGVVYKARHLKLRRFVALKVLLPELSQSSEKIARFHIEANAVARLQHPNIVQIFEVGDADGRPFIALELVEGGTLADKLGKPWPLASAVLVVEQLARAIQFAHERGIIHRDLKPANIMLDAGGVVRGEWPTNRSKNFGNDFSDTTPHSLVTTYQPKITDFGLAKLLDEDPISTPRNWQTQVGVVLGSPPYMAPEQAAGRTHEIGPTTDIHALGTILYELLTGRPPFRGPSLLETLEQIKSQAPPPPSKLAPEMSADLDSICLKCLQKNPRKRYANGQALADDLAKFRQSLASRSQSTRTSVMSRARRHTVLAFQTILAIISALGSGLTVLQVIRADRAIHLESVKSKEVEMNPWNTEISSESLDNLKQKGGQSALQVLNRGLVFCEQGVVNQGMLWLARSLKEAPVEDRELQQQIRISLAKWRGQLNVLVYEFPPSGQIERVGFNADGKIAFTLCNVRSSAANQHSEVSFWDSNTGQQIYKRIVCNEFVTNGCMSPDGTKIILTGPGRAACLLDVQTGRPISQPFLHNGEITCVSFSGNSQLVLTGSADRTAQIWNAKTGRPIGLPLQHQGTVTNVAFSPDSTLAATASEDGTVLLWNSTTGGSFGLQMKHNGPVHALAFSPNGQMLLTGGDDGVAQLWETATGRPIGQPFIHDGRVLSVAFSLDGTQFATGGADRKARIWKTVQAGPNLILSHSSAVQSVQFSVDGRKLLTVGLDFTAQLWDAETGKRMGASLSRPEKVTTAAFSPVGTRILAGSQNGSAKLWEVGGGDSKGTGRSGNTPDMMTADVDQIVTWVERVVGAKIDATLQSNSEERLAVHSPDN